MSDCSKCQHEAGKSPRFNRMLLGSTIEAYDCTVLGRVYNTKGVCNYFEPKAALLVKEQMGVK